MEPGDERAEVLGEKGDQVTFQVSEGWSHGRDYPHPLVDSRGQALSFREADYKLNVIVSVLWDCVGLSGDFNRLHHLIVFSNIK